MDWLRDHQASYGGKWVALKDGALVASASSHESLLRAIADRDDRATLLVAQVDRVEAEA